MGWKGNCSHESWFKWCWHYTHYLKLYKPTAQFSAYIQTEVAVAALLMSPDNASAAADQLLLLILAYIHTSSTTEVS